MRKRTQSREFALQILYQMDITKDDPIESAQNFWLSHADEEIEEQVKTFTEDLVKGVAQKITTIDESISKFATNWKLERMAVVDRNILRLGAYELMFREDIPPKVSINEAVELAKKFSGIESSKFVNGILDKIKLEFEK